MQCCSKIVVAAWKGEQAAMRFSDSTPRRGTEEVPIVPIPGLVVSRVIRRFCRSCAATFQARFSAIRNRPRRSTAQKGIDFSTKRSASQTCAVRGPDTPFVEAPVGPERTCALHAYPPVMAMRRLLRSSRSSVMLAYSGQLCTERSKCRVVPALQ
jgi:hypothetical protein